jgi:hypothetical protein
VTSASATPDVESLSLVRALVTLSEHDLAFADRYLDRAATHLEAVCSRERFQALEQARAALERLAATLREAADRGRWDALKEVAERAAALQAGLQDTEELVRVATDVHRSRGFRPAAAALALVGVVDLPRNGVEHARAAVVERFRELVRHDGAWAEFYRERGAWFDRLQAAGEEAEEEAPALDVSAARKRVADAIERGAFGELALLADTLGHDAATTVESHSRSALAIETADLDRAFPAEALRAAGALGLVEETLAADACGAAGAVCRLRRSTDEDAVSAHVCPPEIRPVLCESLEFLARHAVVSSAGRRYVPSFRPEALLVEAFPESEPDARTPLLDVLGLSRRRGLARRDIEDALSRNTAAVCAALGLDPFQYAVVCIPFDAYVRLAPRRGWGREAMWTHLDGYQVAHGLELRALVGGDVRYGGCHDFCMVGRHYDGAHLTARFAIVRRSRLWGA